MKLRASDASCRFPSFTIYVALGNKQSRKALIKMGFGDYQKEDKALATTNCQDGSNVCLVCFFDGFIEQEDKDQRSALVAHEAFHCAMFWCASIGESEPSEELVAYMTQCCFLSILDCLKKYEAE